MTREIVGDDRPTMKGWMAMILLAEGFNRQSKLIRTILIVVAAERTNSMGTA